MVTTGTAVCVTVELVETSAVDGTVVETIGGVVLSKVGIAAQDKTLFCYYYVHIIGVKLIFPTTTL